MHCSQDRWCLASGSARRSTHHRNIESAPTGRSGITPTPVAQTGTRGGLVSPPPAAVATAPHAARTIRCACHAHRDPQVSRRLHKRVKQLELQVHLQCSVSDGRWCGTQRSAGCWRLPARAQRNAGWLTAFGTEPAQNAHTKHVRQHAAKRFTLCLLHAIICVPL